MSAVLLDILVVLVAAKLAAELAERAGVPAVVGEILAGLAIGPSALGLVEPSEVLLTLGEIGVILLLFQVGLEMDLAELGAVGRASLLVAVVGVALPFAGGVAVTLALGETTNTAIFVGAALTATSVGITARVFGDLRALATVEARTVLGAAVADDVLGLVILTVVVRLVQDGSVSLSGVAGILALAVVFLVATAGLGTRLAPPLFAFVDRRARSAGTLVALALVFTLGVAELAQAAKLATVVGAFVAGLSLARSEQVERIRHELTPVGHLFVPVFFLQIGIEADVARLVHPAVLGAAAALGVVAVLGKLASAAGMAGAPGDRLLVGLGMLPRGEVGLIFAGIGLREGILDGDLYAAVLLVVLGTTLATPPLLGRRLRGRRTAGVPAGVPPPEGGWLVIEAGVVDLRPGCGTPASDDHLEVGLGAALAVARTRPGPALLAWLAAGADEPLAWHGAARARFFELLRHGDARSWRFVESTGLLARALPELARALQRRRADPAALDPAAPFRFPVLARAHELVEADAAPLAYPERLALAALLVDLDAGPELARQVVTRLDMGADAEADVALLVAERTLLRAAAARLDGLDEAHVLPIAAHLERPERARALYLLSVALDAGEPWQAQRLDALHRMVQGALDHPEVSGAGAAGLVERRRAAAIALVGGGTPAADRLTHAPGGWLARLSPADAAALAELVEPLAPAGELRVAVRPAEAPGSWRVELAGRDRHGLLAAMAQGLGACGLSVQAALRAIWPDGGAADTFTVTGPAAPEPAAVRAAVLDALRNPASAAGRPGAAVAFDDRSSPWYTLCSVEADDEPGMLHALAAAFTAAGADVHGARVATVDGRARDRFELTDRRGAKLGAAVQDAIAAAVRRGSPAPPRRRRRRPPTRRPRPSRRS